MQAALGRAALIAIMLGGGLLYAGISQAQDANAPAERGAELVAATGGPAPTSHLAVFARDTAYVDVRDDDVAAVPTGAAPLALISGTASSAKARASDHGATLAIARK